MGRTRDRSNEVGLRGQELFPTLLPECWLKRPRQPDYHIDFVVEIKEDGRPSGIEFGVQLKSTEKPGPGRHFDLDVETLRYFIGKAKFPVFLVTLSIVSRSARWVFVQEWADMHDGGRCLKNKETVRIPVPRANDLANHEELARAVKAAVLYMRERHPGSIQAALRFRKAELEALDDRVQIDITATAGRETIGILPKTPFPFGVRYKGKSPDEFRGAVREMIEGGAPCSISACDVEFVGFDLLNSLLGDSGRLSLAPRARRPGQINLVSRSADDGLMLGLPGVITAGTRRARFVHEAEGNPIRVSFEIEMPPAGQTPTSSLNFQIDLRVWVGKPVRLLPYFDQTLQLLNSFHSGQVLSFEFLVEGTRVFRGKVEPDAPTTTRGPHVLVEWISKAQRVLVWFNASPVLPDLRAIDDDTIELAEFLFDLVTAGVSERPWPNRKITTVSPARLSVDAAPGELTLRPTTQGTVSLLGVDLPMPAATYHISDCRVSECRQEGPRDHSITWSTSEGSVLRAELVDGGRGGASRH